MTLTRKEQALICLIRRLGHGTLERIGVQNGEPQVVLNVTQRIDLTRDNEMQAALCGIVDFAESAEETEKTDQALPAS